MKIYINEILEELDSGRLYRILWIDNHNNCCFLIEINDETALPFPRKVKEITEEILADQLIKNRDYQSFININTSLTDKEKQKRDEAWECISRIVENEPDIYIPVKRGQMVQSVIIDKNTTKRTIYKYLRRYWQRGKSINSLVPDYKNSGGRGKEKSSGLKKRGRPAKYVATNVNVDEDIRKIFRLAINKYYLNFGKNSLTYAYNMMVKEFFADDYYYENGIKKVIISKLEELPSFRQFRYWYQKENNVETVLQKRLGSRVYEKDHRALLGSSTFETFGPGTRFQIDATIADVYLVSEYNSDWIIGRPIIYLVVDVFSRMVAGIYVGLEGPSWLGAMMALENTTKDKQLFCKEYDIEISKNEWPSEHLPNVLLADRGEFEGYNVERLITAFNLQVENSAPYRADSKGIVERMFRTIQTRVKPFLPGYIDKDFQQRGSQDYRLNAKLTMKDFTKLIIRQVIFHNTKHYLESYIRDKDMIKDDVKPIPVELWKWGIENRSGKLRYYQSEVVKMHLLPREKATITHRGIKFKNMYYSSKKTQGLGWYSLARQKGTWKEEVIYDPRDMSSIYIIGVDGNLDKCHLLEHQVRYMKNGIDDITYLHEYERLQKKESEHGEIQGNIDLISESVFEVNAAVNQYNKTKTNNLNKTSKVKGIENNRKMEKENLRKSELFSFIEENNSNPINNLNENSNNTETDVFKRKSIKELIATKHIKIDGEINGNN